VAAASASCQHSYSNNSDATGCHSSKRTAAGIHTATTATPVPLAVTAASAPLRSFVQQQQRRRYRADRHSNKRTTTNTEISDTSSDVAAISVQQPWELTGWLAYVKE
jgi:hypothetical protein